MSANLYGLLRDRFPADTARPLIETPTGRVVTYEQIDLATARLAHRLARLGVRRGDRVAAQIEKSPEAVALYLACLRGGFVYLPLNPAYRDEEVAFFAADAEPALLVADPERSALARLAARFATLDAEGAGTLTRELDAESADGEIANVSPDDAAAILYTSGTTGRAKGAVLSHANLASNARALHEAWGFQPDDVLLHALPIFHAHGLFVALNTTLWNGTSMLFLPRFEVDAVLEALPRATVMMGVPTYYTRLLADPRFGREHARGVRLFISGSAPLLAETFEAFRARTGHAILERYGMTETGMNTSNPLDGERVPGSVGPPLPGVECRVCDGDGRELARGEVGALEVRGPNVFRGYWRLPEKTASEFREGGWFVTGDLARIDARGYVHLVGRAKDLVITGGLNVHPREVEEVLDAHPGVLESAVFGVPDADFGEAVAAAVVLREPLREEELVAFARQRIASFKAPKRVHVVDELPRNAMGKVQKNALRERFGPPERR